MNRTAKLLCGRRCWIVWSQVSIGWFVAVGPPMSLILAGLRVKDSYSVIPVAIRNIEFVCLRINKCLGGQAEVISILTTLTLPRLSNLHQKFAGSIELQHHTVVVI